MADELDDRIENWVAHRADAVAWERVEEAAKNKAAAMQRSPSSAKRSVFREYLVAACVGLLISVAGAGVLVALKRTPPSPEVTYAVKEVLCISESVETDRVEANGTFTRDQLISFCNTSKTDGPIQVDAVSGNSALSNYRVCPADINRRVKVLWSETRKPNRRACS